MGRNGKALIYLLTWKRRIQSYVLEHYFNLDIYEKKLKGKCKMVKDRRILCEKRSMGTFNFSVSGWAGVLKDLRYIICKIKFKNEENLKTLLNLKITEFMHVRHEKLVYAGKMLVFSLMKRFLSWFYYYLHCDYLVCYWFGF